MASPEVTPFFDEVTNTITYVVADPETRQCTVIDPVLDYDLTSGRTSTTSVDAVIEFIEANNLSLDIVLETHVHADHLSAAPVLKKRLQARTAIGDHITAIQTVFTGIFNLNDVATDGSQFDVLLASGDQIPIGSLQAKVMYTPGHTPACVTFVIGDAAFVGDTLFMPDSGKNTLFYLDEIRGTFIVFESYQIDTRVCFSRRNSFILQRKQLCEFTRQQLYRMPPI